MRIEPFTRQHRALGRAAIWVYILLSAIYTLTTTLGLLSLKSPDEPIGDPYFTIMELLIIIIVLLLVLIMVTVHAYASSETKVYSLTALAFMILLAGITSSVHFVILTIRGQFEATAMTGHHLFLSFTWPSMVYALDILAWDVFFALSMIFAAFVFTRGGLEKAVRSLMITSGVLSLLGLIGAPLANMTIRNIGIVGYALVAPVAFLVLSFVFSKTEVSGAP